jgi:hypothetical protein
MGTARIGLAFHDGRGIPMTAKNTADEFFANAANEVQDKVNKQKRKSETRAERTVRYDGPTTDSEGEAIVETSNDGVQHFVKITLRPEYAEPITAADVKGNSSGEALTAAEEEFERNGFGYITLNQE